MNNISSEGLDGYLCKKRAGIIEESVLLEGFGVLLHFLYEKEADHICGADHFERSFERANYRNGHTKRSVVTCIGAVPLRIPHLKYLHPRPSMAKRARRLNVQVLQVLDRIHASGVTAENAGSLIKMLWTLELPDALFSNLAAKLVVVLEGWRQRTGTGAPCAADTPADTPLAASAPAPVNRVEEMNAQVNFRLPSDVEQPLAVI